MTNRVSFAPEVRFNNSPPKPTMASGGNSASSALIYHLGGMCIRDYQLALQRSINELKSREQQVNSLYSSLVDREDTIARLTRENESLKLKLKQATEQSPSHALSRHGSGRGTIISTHELAGELHQTVLTPLPLMHASHTADGSALLTKPRRDRLRAALAKNDLLGRLDFEQADGLISRMSEQRVDTGHVIIKEGEPGIKVYVMEEGEADIYRQGQFLCRLLAPFVFGELAVIYNCPRSATVIAAANCRLWSIENKAFQKCMTRIRQRTINKIATDLKSIGIFSLLSRSTLVSIVDAGEELHFSPGSHVHIDVGSFYILTEGMLAAPVCSCGNTDGHRQVPASESCRRRVIELKATACFFSRLSEKTLAALGDSLSSGNSENIFNLLPSEISTLKASEENATRVTCFRLDTNYVIRALDKKREHSSSTDTLTACASLPNDSAVTDSSSNGENRKKNGGVTANNNSDSLLNMADLSIIAILPSRDTFSHMFCIVDNKTPRRNAVFTTGLSSESLEQITTTTLPKQDSLTSAGVSVPIVVGSNGNAGSPNRSGCYLMRWILRQRADSAGMTERLNHERQHLAICRSCDFVVQLVDTMHDAVSDYFVYEPCLGGTLELLMKDFTSSSSAVVQSGSSTSRNLLMNKSVRRQRTTNSTSSGPSSRGGGIDEEWARFFLACIIEALDFLHANGIVHRNVCPASVAITSRGYAKLGDFTWTKAIGARSRTFSLCGPVERLAPEVMLNKGHGMSADRWALGILLYEMIVGKTPFLREDPMLTCSAILSYSGSSLSQSTSSASNDNVESLDFPRRISKAAKDAVRRLCRASPADRINFDDLRQHPFYTLAGNNAFDWSLLRSLHMVPPFVPVVSSSTDLSNFPGARKLVGTIPVSSLVSSCAKSGEREPLSSNNRLSSNNGDDAFLMPNDHEVLAANMENFANARFP